MFRPTVENRRVSLLFGRIGKRLVGLSARLLFIRGAEVPSSVSSSHKKISRGRDQVELLLHVTLYLIFDKGVCGDGTLDLVRRVLWPPDRLATRIAFHLSMLDNTELSPFEDRGLCTIQSTLFASCSEVIPALFDQGFVLDLDKTREWRIIR